MRRSQRPPTARPAPRSSTALAEHLFPSLAAAAIGVVVFRGSLDYFFTQDDFAALARAAGLLPRFVEPWRWLSLQAFFDLMRPLAGLDPRPYHAAGLVLHASTAALLAAWLARALSGPSALVGASFFAAHAASFTALYWISTIGDLASLFLCLLAMILALRSDRSRWWALPLYAASLMSKESVLPLPVCIAAVSAWRRSQPVTRSGPSPIRDPLLWAMSLIGAAYAIYFVSVNDLGPGTSPGGAPYTAGLGPHVIENLLTYAGWTLNAFLPTVHGWSDAPDPTVYPWAAATLLAWAAGAFWQPLRRRGWLAAGACYAALLLPVLPLPHHTYHYYLYAPLAAVAWCVASLFDALGEQASGARGRGAGRSGRHAFGAAWIVAAALAGLLALNGAALVRKIETAPFMRPDMRSEPLVDRARIAGAVMEGLRRAELRPGTTLVFWSPEARADAGTASAESYWERNVRSALYDGVAVRVMFPQVAAVRFARTPPPPGDSALVAVYRVTGEVQVFTAAVVDSILSGGR
jgi:hypothetical protein